MPRVRERSLPGMLGAGALLDLQAPAFQTEPGRNRGKAVKLAIGPGDVFLLGVRVVLGEDVQVQRHVTGGKRGERGLDFFSNSTVQKLTIGRTASATLSMRCRRGSTDGTFCTPRAAAKNSSSSQKGRGLEIALALAEQAEIAAQHAGGGDPLAGRGLGHPRGERGVAVDGQTDQGHAGLGRVELAVGLLDGEPRKGHENLPG